MLIRSLAALAFVIAGSASAQTALTDVGVRAFVARQERAWNAADLKAYFATFAPDAVFVDQALSSENKVVPFGRSTPAQARAQTGRVLAKSKIHEQAAIDRVELSPDGRSARVLSHVTSRIERGGAVRLSCAQRVQAVALAGGRIVSRGQTDTAVRCRR
ncbi:hypothetical protein DJ021_03975 [Phenylobacterium hankyongense]|uniref:Uncharacterized protein n=1 Tax=Phenylobacterium hankyongense TaxID=1813876 RepID=A0A328AXV6_9CAUL|nr:DUF4440 domain-containing protein [Phenylobacterium hankyongense]RAK59021.1 hypothetical protein DJ021_03975 [Phenylobacterium hankyongense]